MCWRVAVVRRGLSGGGFTIPCLHACLQSLRGSGSLVCACVYVCVRVCVCVCVCLCVCVCVCGSLGLRDTQVLGVGVPHYQLVNPADGTGVCLSIP